MTASHVVGIVVVVLVIGVPVGVWLWKVWLPRWWAEQARHLAAEEAERARRAKEWESLTPEERQARIAISMQQQHGPTPVDMRMGDGYCIACGKFHDTVECPR